MNIKVAPCKGCERRSESCHAKCEEYSELQIEHKKYKAQEKAYNEQVRRYYWNESGNKKNKKKC